MAYELNTAYVTFQRISYSQIASLIKYDIRCVYAR